MSAAHLAGIPTMTDTVDPKSFRKGDRVLIEGFIGYDYLPSSPSTTWVTSYDSGTHVINVKAIKAHFPASRPIKVGDRVGWQGVIATVIHVHGEKVWAEWQSSHGPASTLLSLEDLKRLPQ